MLSQPSRSSGSTVRLLVSVKNAAEAAVALQESISILDVKAPERGALGQPLDKDLEQIGAVQPANPIDRSVACGELQDYIENRQQPPQVPKNFKFFKLGLSGLNQTANWPTLWESQIRRFAGMQPVAVSYADYKECAAPHPEAVMEAGKQLGCQFFLFDTFSKLKRKNIFSFLPQSTLSPWIQQAKNLGMKTVIAGSITQQDVKKCKEMAPDYIGVRRAVCRAGRESELDRDKLSQLVRRLQEDQ
ncbi:MAG: (5-formylfuran-3-yl)methyl phosphate synthase [Planctomycetota bacterium]|nr:(5-formylfuran-3-yl)methyl phosphate synthase [Planctomycetota bacterium]